LKLCQREIAAFWKNDPHGKRIDPGGDAPLQGVKYSNFSVLYKIYAFVRRIRVKNLERAGVSARLAKLLGRAPRIVALAAGTATSRANSRRTDVTGGRMLSC